MKILSDIIGTLPYIQTDITNPDELPIAKNAIYYNSNGLTIDGVEGIPYIIVLVTEKFPMQIRPTFMTRTGEGGEEQTITFLGRFYDQKWSKWNNIGIQENIDFDITFSEKTFFTNDNEIEVYLKAPNDIAQNNNDNDGFIIALQGSNYTNKILQVTDMYATTYYATSDQRLKENIKPFEYKKSITDLITKEFNFKETGKHSIGFIAQELQDLYPELVHDRGDGYLIIEENKLVYLLLEEIRELKERIKQLEG